MSKKLWILRASSCSKETRLSIFLDNAFLSESSSLVALVLKRLIANLSAFFCRYIATVGNKVTKRQVQAILDGTEVQGVHCVPESVEVVAAAEQGDSRIKLRIVVS